MTRRRTNFSVGGGVDWGVVFLCGLVILPIVLMLLAAVGLFGSNVQQLVSDLCLSFTSQRVIIYQR